MRLSKAATAGSVLDMSEKRVALVTGGSSGIGRDIVQRFLAAGYNVAVTGRDGEKMARVFYGIPYERLYCIQADARNAELCYTVVSQVLERFGRLDVLINNVGGGAVGQTLISSTIASFNDMMALNARSCWFMMVAARTALIASRGCIINFSSVLAHRPVAGLGPYSASKAAVEMMTQTAALELAPYGVRVLCISPATVQTGFHVAAGMSSSAADAYYDASAKAHPLGRIGQPHDISDMVMFLAEKAEFMTGSVLHVDGGRLLTSAAVALR